MSKIINELSLSQKDIESFNANGFLVYRNALTSEAIERFKLEMSRIFEMLIVEHHLDIDVKQCKSLDEICFKIIKLDRKYLSYIYDGMKGFPLFFQIFSNQHMLDAVNTLQNGHNPYMLDVNFRIDLPGESKFAFDWHQDFWYTHSDPNSLVFWFPFTHVNENNGKLKLVSFKETKGKIFKVVETKNFAAYNGAYDLLESFDPTEVNESELSPGDVLIFKHSVMHKSGVNKSDDKARWTLQLRYSDYNLPIFKLQNWRAGHISREGSSYSKVQEKIQNVLNKS